MTHKVIRINASVVRSRTKQIVDTLKKVGVLNIYVTAGRGPLLEPPVGLVRFLSGRDVLRSQPVDFISFFVKPKDEEKALNLIVAKGKLTIPGMGTAYTQELDLSKQHPLCALNDLSNVEAKKVEYYTNLVGISCVVQRGQGDDIARVVLESATAVPTISYGVGTGIRDKLGLLRITIPAEKEVLSLVTTSWDAGELLETMISKGKLDQPGKGFINTFPIKQGIINTKVSSEQTKHAASMEQVIAAIDGIKGGMEWRKERGEHGYKGQKRAFFGGCDLNVICNDGAGVDLVKAAMQSGAQGATIEKLTLRGPLSKDKEQLQRAREVCKMMVPKDKLEDIVAAMVSAGALSDKAQAMLYSCEVDQAFTYIKAAS